MTARYMDLLFSDGVKAAQAAQGSREAYARHTGAPDAPDRLGEAEAAFIAARDSFYLASVGQGGWPYIQHRGGPAGFVKVLDPGRLAFADFRGNRQYISLGNIGSDDRVSLFFMDYAQRARLKLAGRMRALPVEDAPEAAELPGYRGRAERVLAVSVEAFDWNCSQHIVPRYTVGDVERVTARLTERIAVLEARLAERQTG
jgi:predicted pyridoxine 5'-phosphate oxidase superfamily flavin-nucleotide-binding protein